MTRHLGDGVQETGQGFYLVHKLAKSGVCLPRRKPVGGTNPQALAKGG